MDMTQKNNKNFTHVPTQVKRFLECVQGDPGFRALLKPLSKNAANNYLRSRGVFLDISALFPFYENGFMVTPDQSTIDQNPLLSEWHQYYRKIKLHANQTADEFCDTLKLTQLKNWRQRQLEWFKDLQADKDPISILIAYELSDGCSLNCPFCAFSAKKLRDVFTYTDENRALWQGVLKSARETFGKAAAVSCCYHSTEPADNADYALLVNDFYEANGVVPQTTTAAPLRDLDWTKKLMKLRTKCSDFFDRFSVHSPDDLAKTHKQFTPEELAHVPLVILGKNSLLDMTKAGKHRPSGENNHSTDFETIECTSGFIVNMCRHSVKLVVPCAASNQHPNGSRILAEGRFKTPSDFANLLEKLCDEGLPTGFPPSLKFRAELTYATVPDGFELKGRVAKMKLQGKKLYRDAGVLINEKSPAPEGFLSELTQLGHDPKKVFALMHKLFTKGAFDELPA